ATRRPAPSARRSAPSGRDRLAPGLAGARRIAEGAEERPAHRIVAGVVFGMPLDPDRKRPGACDRNRLDRLVRRPALEDGAPAGLADRLTVQRVRDDLVGADDPREFAAGAEPHRLAQPEDHLRVLAPFRHPVAVAAGQIADLRPERAAERDVD